MATGTRSSQETAASLVGAWADHLLAHGYRSTTIRHYPRIAREWLAFLAVERARYDDVEPVVVDRFIARLRTAGKTSWTIRCTLSPLRTWYKWLKRRRYVWDNPFDCLERMRVERHLPKPLMESQVTALIDAEPDPENRAMWEVFYATGCRISTLLDMELQDLRLEERKVFFRTVKRGRERYGILGRKAIEALRAYLAWRERRLARLGRSSPWLWIGQKGSNRLQPYTVRLRFKHAAVRAGITERVWPHRLRHSTGTHMLEHGADLRTIQEVLDHSSLMTTQIYTQVSKKHLEESFQKAHPRA